MILIVIFIFIVYFLDKANPDGWLSFFGSIIAVGGVYYQVHRDIKNERELQFSLNRPYVVLAKTDTYSNEKIFMPEELYNVENFGFSRNKVLAASRKISLKNLSDNLLMSVKIVINYSDGYKENIMVDRIERNTTLLFIPGSAQIAQLNKNINDVEKLLKSRNDIEKKELEDILNNFQVEDEELNEFVREAKPEEINERRLDILIGIRDEINNYFIKLISSLYAEIESIGIYFTTSVREKIYLEFEIESQVHNPV